MGENTINTFIIPRDKIMIGMYIDRDIHNDKGQIIISKDYYISKESVRERLIKMLKDNHIKGIYVRTEEELPEKVIEELLLTETLYIGDLQELEDKKEVKEGLDHPQEVMADIAKSPQERKFFIKELPASKKEINKKFHLILKRSDQESEINSIQDNIHKTLEIVKSSKNVFQIVEQLKKIESTHFFYSYHVAITSYMIGKWLDFSQKKLSSLYLTAMLADIGILKLATDLSIKPEEVSRDTVEEYEKHIIYSCDLLRNCSFYNNEMATIILSHHETYDGKGFPLQKKGVDIPLLSRIIYISDLYTEFTVNQVFNAIQSIAMIERLYMKKVDMTIFFLMKKRIYDCFIGQKAKVKDVTGIEGEIVFFDHSHNEVLIKTQQGVEKTPMSYFDKNLIEFV